MIAPTEAEDLRVRLHREWLGQQASSLGTAVKSLTKALVSNTLKCGTGWEPKHSLKYCQIFVPSLASPSFNHRTLIHGSETEGCLTDVPGRRPPHLLPVSWKHLSGG